MEVILIRHFMTKGNLEHRYIGTTDEPLLSDKALARQLKGGVRQAAQTVRYPEVQAVAVSSLRRCIETADMIYPDVRKVVCRELRECDFGLFENKNYEELKDHPEYQRWLLSGGRIPFPKGEGRDEFCARCVKGFLCLAERFMEEALESAAFVVHGGTIMAVLDRLAPHEEGFYHWQCKNGGGYRAKLYEEEWRRGVRRLTEIERL